MIHALTHTYINTYTCGLTQTQYTTTLPLPTIPTDSGAHRHPAARPAHRGVPAGGDDGPPEAELPLHDAINSVDRRAQPRVAAVRDFVCLVRWTWMHVVD